MASLSLALHAAHRRTELQASYRQLDAQISQLDERVMDQAFKRFGAKLLMTHPGVGPITALAREVSWAIRRGSPTTKRWPAIWG